MNELRAATEYCTTSQKRQNKTEVNAYRMFWSKLISQKLADKRTSNVKNYRSQY